MLLPMLAKEVEVASLEQFIEDPSWLFQQKLDGHRLLLSPPGMDDCPPSATTRNGTPYTRRLPKGLQDFRFPPGTKPGDIIFDGELVGDTFWIFDVLGVAEPLSMRQRRVFLENLFLTDYYQRKFGQSFKLVPQAVSREEKIALAEKALANNFEGLMLKKVDSAYVQGGRTPHWLKLKFVKTIDVFVMGVRTDGKDSVDLGLIKWTGPGILHDSYEVVNVGRASLIGKEKNGTIAVGDVLEVRYLYCNNSSAPRLYQPTILRKRTDKGMYECVTEQLQYTNKSVLEAL